MKENNFSAPHINSAKQINLLFAAWLSAFINQAARFSAGGIAAAITICCLGLGLAETARAQTSGSLDAAFGTGGKVVTPIGSANDGASAAAVQADGKIVVAGYADNGMNTDFAVARYNADGTLDATFGTGGKVVTAIGASNDFASSVAIQSGKIVVAGYAAGGTNIDFAVARYNADGTLDTTFGTGGKVTTAVGNLDDFASSVAIQADGKIVVAGATEITLFSNDFAVLRYNVNGSLDTTFGTGGKVVAPIGNSDDFASSVAIQTDGKIVVAGASSDGATDDFAVARFNANGALDTTFGTGGKVVTPVGSSDDFASSVIVQTDGKIIVAGDSNTGNNDFALVRYNAGGTLDTTFGTGGKVVTPIGSSNDYLYAAALQPNGKIVAAGFAFGTNDDFALARYNTNGTLDTTFGAGGKTVTPIGAADDYAMAVTVQADGKIIAAGSSSNGTNLDFAVARYFGDSASNPVPVIANITPNNRLVGSAAFELIVNGSNFVVGSIVRFNGQDRATIYVSETVLRVQITAADLQTAGQFPVTVFSPAPGGGLSNAVNFTVGTCSYSLNPVSQTFVNAGGSSTISVVTQAGCAYAAVSNSPFITVTAGANGTGNGTVSFTVAANTGPARTGTITVAGQTFTATQGDGCVYSISPSATSYAAAGGTGSFSVTTGAGCAYAATTAASFITINNGSGTGSGTVSFTVAANTGADRTGTITVAGQTFTVTQTGGCTYVLSPTSVNIGSSGGTGSFTVTTGTGCAYSATTTSTFITITNGTGTNSGTVTFTVAANTGADRVGTITVNGQTFTVNQSGGCSYSLMPVSTNVSASGGAGSFTVTTGTGCAYSAVSNSSFIVINSGGSGNGSGAVNFTVQANNGVARSGTITVNGQIFTVNQAAGTAAARTAFDFDGDGKADVSVFRPDSGIWYLLNSNTGFTGAQFGVSTDRIVPADYDGDGKTDLAVYRDGTWYAQRSAQGFVGIAFGAATDIPAPADYDGDGKAEFAVYRPSNGTWYLYNLATNAVSGVTFGAAEDKPVAGDYDGDGKADIAVFRPSNNTWYTSTNPAINYGAVVFGAAEDKPVPADYDGDGKTDVAVFRPSNGTWYLQRSQAGFTGIQFGLGSDLPTPADYDGDGKTDVAVFRSGTWYVQRSQAGFTGVSFGAASDKPIPNAFVR